MTADALGANISPVGDIPAARSIRVPRIPVPRILVLRILVPRIPASGRTGGGLSTPQRRKAMMFA